MATKKILVVFTSAGAVPATGKKTGWWLSEFAHPFDEFVKAGYEVVVASPKGGEPPLDPGSVEQSQDPISIQVLNKKEVWSNTAKLSEFLGRASEFDAIFYPGGHGPVYDLATDSESQQLINEFAAAGKVVSAVCHGPAVLVNVKKPDGTYLIAGHDVTGFSDVEEDIVQMTPFMPFSLEGKLNEASGGKYHKTEKPWDEYVIVSGKIVTGQNPGSAKGVGEAVLKLIA